MTATTITYLAAGEHINDLFREAEYSRQASEARTLRRVKRSLLRLLARPAAAVVELDPGVIPAAEGRTGLGRELKAAG